jgi:lipopolysaccharide biosynthesis glycosyltransferase
MRHGSAMFLRRDCCAGFGVFQISTLVDVSGMMPAPEAEEPQYSLVMRGRRRVGKRVRWVGARIAGMPRRPPSPVIIGRFDDYAFAREMASNPIFTRRPGERLPEVLAQAAAQDQILRAVEIPGAGIRLSLAEIESIREHGIVRMVPELILGTTPPPPSVAFAAVTNDKYAPGVEALVLSLLQLYPQMTSDVVVFHDEGLSDFTMSRMLRIYPHMRFEHRSVDRYDIGQIGDSVNHKRVGLLGYLSLDAISLEGYERVILLDADTVVLKDISRLWAGTGIYAVPDAGALPFGMIAKATGKPVINSGMISLPASELGAARFEAALAQLPGVLDIVDPMLDRFADQKFWNMYLAGRNVEFVPVNYNTNKWLVDNYFPEMLGDVAVLHITGPKPWFEFTDRELVSEQDLEDYHLLRRRSPVSVGRWNETYLPAVKTNRILGFRADCGAGLEELRGTRTGRPAVLIGNGPSLKNTDLSQFDGFEKFVFNWFVHHDDFDVVAPDHLVLASHMFFGGWHTARPSIPPSFLQALARHSHRPRIWTSWYFKDLIEGTPELVGYDISYFLFEKPFKQNVTRLGAVGLDLLSPLTDAHTGVLTAGVPIGLHLGCRDLVLVGCDADYSSAAGSYFYDAGLHASKTTDESHLVGTWTAGGTGQYAYSRVAQMVAERGARLLDATVGGKLTVLEKLPLATVRSLLPDPVTVDAVQGSAAG